MAKTEENGVWKGRTEATLEGIAGSMDALWKRLDALPCEARWGYISSLNTGQRYLWAVVLFVWGIVTAIAVKIYGG